MMKEKMNAMEKTLREEIEQNKRYFLIDAERLDWPK